MLSTLASRNGRWTLTPTLLTILCLQFAGCHQAPPQAGNSRLASVAEMYGKYRNSNRGQSPPDELQFREFLNSHPDLDKVLKTAGVSTVDELFVSERDNQPFVLLFGEDAKTGSVMGYEHSGLNGKRIVGYQAGYVDELDAAEFQELIGKP